MSEQPSTGENRQNPSTERKQIQVLISQWLCSISFISISIFVIVRIFFPFRVSVDFLNISLLFLIFFSIFSASFWAYSVTHTLPERMNLSKINALKMLDLNFESKINIPTRLTIAALTSFLLFRLALAPIKFLSVEIMSSRVPPESVRSHNHWALEVNKLRISLTDIQDTWGRLENISKREYACKLVRDRSVYIGDQFKKLSKENLGDHLHTKIETYRSAQYSYIMASDVECNKSVAKKYARDSIIMGGLALEEIQKAYNTTGDYGSDLKEWLNTDFTQERIYFHNALGYALLYRLGEIDEVDKIVSSVEKIKRDLFFVERAIDKDNNRLISPILNNIDSSKEKVHIIHPCQRSCDIDG